MTIGPFTLISYAPSTGTSLTSAPGIIVAGLGYGLIESFTAGYISTRAREIVGFGLVILVLVARPWGLLGAKPSRRV